MKDRTYRKIDEYSVYPRVVQILRGGQGVVQTPKMWEEYFVWMGKISFSLFGLSFSLSNIEFGQEVAEGGLAVPLKGLFLERSSDC